MLIKSPSSVPEQLVSPRPRRLETLQGVPRKLTGTAVSTRDPACLSTVRIDQSISGNQTPVCYKPRRIRNNLLYQRAILAPKTQDHHPLAQLSCLLLSVFSNQCLFLGLQLRFTQIKLRQLNIPGLRNLKVPRRSGHHRHFNSRPL